MGRGRDRAGLLVLLVAELAAVAGLHRLGSVDGLGVPWGSLGTWVRTAPPEEVVGALLRAGALGLTSWLLLSHGAVRGGRTRRRPPCGPGPGGDRPPLGASAGPAGGGGDGGRRVRHRRPPRARRPAAHWRAGLAAGPRHRPPWSPPATSTSTTTRPATTPTARSGRSGGLESVPIAPSPAPPPATAPSPEPAPSASTVGASYVVGPGDSLWSIAATHLARRTGRAPADVADVEVAPYWVAVVAANRDRLQSGDPNLIYPGEALELPPVG